MKKSHKWEEVPTIEVRCPHCGKWDTLVGSLADEGDTIRCGKCDKLFELGRPK